MDTAHAARQHAAARAADALVRVRADIRRLCDVTHPHPSSAARDTTVAMLEALHAAERRLQAQVDCWAGRINEPTTEDTA